ncbi:hypothetical protein ABBQ32_001446 [Trebouxia sp. C0010 RCD-2024]
MESPEGISRQHTLPSVETCIHAQLRRLKVLQDHLSFKNAAWQEVHMSPCRAPASHSYTKVTKASAAVALIPDSAVITVAGFVGLGFPEYLVKAVRARYDSTQHPKDLHVVAVAACGDGKGRGLDELAVEGLISTATFGWAGLSPKLLKMIVAKKVNAWNLPLGVVSHIIRDTAAGRPGPVTPIGLGTFVDPCEQGGKLTSPDQADIVHLVQVGRKQLLWYEAPPKVHAALLRGTTADLDGNISFEKEALHLDSLNMAMAAHNSGGIVIVQVERIVERGSLPTRTAHIPGAIVDKIVLAPPENHWMHLGSGQYDGSLSGEVRAPSSAIASLPMNERKVIAHRAMLMIHRPHAIVNLGIGMPEGVATVCTTHGHHNPSAMPINLSTEAGSIGGVPTGGLRFGASHNAAAHMPCATMIDFYNGGGVDVACLGMAEVDEEGNVNVSYFPPRTPGCGGFIDISQTAKKVIFVGSFTSGGLQVHLEGSKLHIDQEGRSRKFRSKVQQKTFAASSANGRPIMYVTERAVFKLVEGKGLELVEVAPGVDVQEHVLDLMDFKPLMPHVKQMDPRCFSK